MNSIIEKFTGLDKMSDQVIATDLLITSKSGIKEFAVAITEITSPKLRAMLINQLNEIISSYERITEYMMSKGYYNAYHMQEQYQIDKKAADTALSLKEFMS